MLINKREAESNVTPQTHVWKFYSPGKSLKHSVILENEEHSARLKKRLDPASTITPVHDVKITSLFKRGFFGNEGQGVITLRSQDRQQPTTSNGKSEGVPDTAPLVILPAGALMPLSNGLSLEKNDANLSIERQTNGPLDDFSEGSKTKITSPASSTPQASSLIGDGGSSNLDQSVTSIPIVPSDSRESDAEAFRSLPQGAGSLKNKNGSTESSPHLWLIGILCFFLGSAFFLCMALKKRGYRVTFKPFRIHKIQDAARSEESRNIGQTPATSQPLTSSTTSLNAYTEPEGGYMTSKDQKHSSFESTLAEVGPNPRFGVKKLSGNLLDRLRRFFRFKDSNLARPSSIPSFRSDIQERKPEEKDDPKPPLPEISLSPPNPIHQRENPAADDQNMAGIQRQNHGLSISAMSPLIHSPMHLCNDNQRETVELHCIRTDQIEIIY